MTAGKLLDAEAVPGGDGRRDIFAYASKTVIDYEIRRSHSASVKYEQSTITVRRRQADQSYACLMEPSAVRTSRILATSVVIASGTSSSGRYWPADSSETFECIGRSVAAFRGDRGDGRTNR